jgi:4-aminobutyrate--pyruvate transaminase
MTLQQSDIASHLHPFTNAIAHEEAGPDVIVKGEGSWLYDAAGHKLLDGMAGLWAVSLGYSEQRLIDAASRQLAQLPYYHTFAHKSNVPAIELAQKLLSMLPFPMSKAFFTNSGSEAVDTAIKLATAYRNATGQAKKKIVIARQRAYHGVGMMSGSATGLPVVHRAFDLPIPSVVHVSCPHYWKYAGEGESETQFTSRLVAELDQLIEKLGAENVNAFIAEPVMGAGGVIVPPEGYFEAVQQVLKKHDVLMIADEVVCGFGRTGRMFGSEAYGIRPDIMTFAKQLSSAYMPIGAVTINDAVYAAIRSSSAAHGVFGHGYTYSGHPVAAAVALETLRIYEERRVDEHVRRASEVFFGALGRLKEHPLVGEIRGVGLIAAVELVASPGTRKPFATPGLVNAHVARKAYEAGLITRALPAGDALGLCPPLFTPDPELELIALRLQQALDETLDFARKQAA